VQKSSGTSKSVPEGIVKADVNTGLSMGNNAGTDPYAKRRKPVDGHVMVEPRRWSQPK
jgi:hypothetical protein